MLSQPVTLVDVRADGERVSMLPDAVALDQLKWPPETGSKTVFYCIVGYRSSLEVRRLAATAPDGAKLYSMALLDWVNAGGDLVDASGQLTTRLHALGAKWESFTRPECGGSFLRIVHGEKIK